MSTIFAAELPNVDLPIFEFWLERDNGLLGAHAKALGHPRPAGACSLLVKDDDGAVIRRVDVYRGTVDESYLRSYTLPTGILWAGQTETNALRLETLQESVAEAVNSWLSPRWDVTMVATEGEPVLNKSGAPRRGVYDWAYRELKSGKTLEDVWQEYRGRYCSNMTDYELPDERERLRKAIDYRRKLEK